MAGLDLAPDSEAALAEAVADAVTRARPLEISGAGTKRGLGRPVAAPASLSLRRLSGITYYQPGELVMEALAGTRRAEIEAALAENGQHLAFEPPAPPGGGDTIGGIFGCNLAGPRRPFAGAARDHLLGVRAVSGRAEPFASGGRVVKNVTGYDMGKLLCGAYGTLAVLARVTFKVLPRAEAARTVLILGLDARAGLAALARAAAGPWDISAGCHLGTGAAARSAVDYVASAGAAVTALRLEGTRGAVAERCAALRAAFDDLGPGEELHSHNTATLWSEVRDGALLPPEGEVWRTSQPPAAAAALLDGVGDEAGAVYDWLGARAWRTGLDGATAEAARGLREALAPMGGHAMLYRGDDATRATVPVFAPEPPPLAALTRRIKSNFDPAGVLNPGRMWEGL